MMQALGVRLTTPCQILIPHPGRTLDVEAVVRALGRDVDVPVRLQRRRRDPEEVLLLDPLEQVGRAGVEEDDHTPNFAYLGLCLMWYEFLGAVRCEATLVWFVGRAGVLEQVEETDGASVGTGMITKKFTRRPLGCQK